jgi:general secretion pathway protein E
MATSAEQSDLVPVNGRVGPESPTDDELSDVLVASGKLRAAERRRVHALRKPGDSLASLLIKLGLVSERDVADALGGLLGMTLLDAGAYPEVAVTENALSYRFMKSEQIVPVENTDDHVAVALADPRLDQAVKAVAVACGKPVVARLGLASDIDAAIERCYGSGRSALGQIVDSTEDDREEPDVERLRDLASEAPVIRLVSLLIERAVKLRASDVHIEPFRNRLVVRYRVDGVLREVESPPTRLTAAVVSRVKIMAKLNIAERRLPQDGRIKIKVQGREIDLRVSCVPTLYGESISIRILSQSDVSLDFAALGLDEGVGTKFQALLARAYGIVLVTGPTGSGKTTTLYTALSRLNTPERKILTVEDPVEYQLDGINQIQVKPQIGLSFGSALRSILRQDPDVIMIGEMRDVETARIAVQSALTGHVVLSTLHTNDAASGVTRLLEMGIEDYLLRSTINGILAQRLVRTLCTGCRVPCEDASELLGALHADLAAPAEEISLYTPGGCEQCDRTGYSGRTAVAELLVIDDSVRRLISTSTEAAKIRETACARGMQTMYRDGLRKAFSGVTTVAEVLRVTQEA